MSLALVCNPSPQRVAIFNAVLESGWLRLKNSAGSIDSALEVIPNARNAPDIILLHAGLLDARGANAIGELREAIGVPVIVLSDKPNACELADCLHAGASGYVHSQFTGRELEQVVDQAAKGGVVADPVSLAGLLVEFPLPGPEAKSNGADGRPDDLPDTDRTILQMLAHGHSTRQIAYELNLAHGTVKNHLGPIYARLRVSRRSEAIYKATRWGLID